MQHTRFTLKNGMRIIAVPIPAVESVTAMVMVGAGSRYESQKNSGISHFLEHMAFKGTKRRPTALEIATLLDGIGAESNAFTSKEVTAYHIKAAASHLDTAFDVLSDILLHSTLPDEEIEREKGVILEEFNMYEDIPMRKIGDIYENLMYGNQPLGWDILGDREVIRNITKNDFVEYKKQLYSASNMTLVVAGKVDPEKIKSLSEKYFSSLASFDTASYPAVVEKDLSQQVLLKTKDTEQTHFALGVRAIGRNDVTDRYPLSVLGAILGGGMSSRLFHEVRERRGLAYYVRAFVERYLDTGYIAAFAGVDSKRAKESIEVVTNEFRKAASDDFKEEEVEKAKEFIKGHFVLGLEDTGAVSVFYGMGELLEDQVLDPGDVLKRIEAVTVEDVKRVAKKYLSDDLTLAVIGNFEDSKEFQSIISK